MNYAKLHILLAAIFLPYSSALSSAVCSGTVTTVRTEQSGRLSANWGYGKKFVCYVNQDYLPTGYSVTISAATCQVTAAELTTALATGIPINVYLPTPAVDCTSLGTGDNVWPTVQPSYYTLGAY
jgi:hypothetical protein